MKDWLILHREKNGETYSHMYEYSNYTENFYLDRKQIFHSHGLKGGRKEKTIFFGSL